uniref:hypothetical protein n=1 Tax=Sphingomonas sp. TaxID=28214 RepID=UPI003565076E
MMRTKTIAVTALLALAALGGCDRTSPAPQPEVSDNVLPADAGTPVDADVETNLAEAAPPPAESAAPAGAPAVTPREAPREAPPAPDTQTLDDADATGMTARVNRGDMVTNTTP